MCRAASLTCKATVAVSASARDCDCLLSCSRARYARANPYATPAPIVTTVPVMSRPVIAVDLLTTPGLLVSLMIGTAKTTGLTVQKNTTRRVRLASFAR